VGLAGESRRGAVHQLDDVVKHMADERSERILREARATIARVDAAQRDWAAENAARDLYQPLVREPPRAAQPQRNDTMPEQNNWESWDRWCRSHVQAGIDMLAKVIGEETGKIHRGINEKIAALENEIGQLKAQLEIVRNAATGAPVDLPGSRKEWRQ
jgi:hypothetical protein